MKNWFLYVIRGKDGSFYTGITTDVKRRFEEHRGNNGRGSKYLRGKKPLELVLEMEIGSKSLALKVEGRVKKLTKVKKEMFVGGRLNIQEIIPADWAENDSCLRRP